MTTLLRRLRKFSSRLFHALVDRGGRIFFRIVFWWFLLKSKKKKVAVFDLDNTLFDTWPLRKKFLTDRLVYQNVKPFSGVLDLLNEKRQAGYEIVFISARHYFYYPVTYRSLSSCLETHLASALILVPAAIDKLFFINLLIKKFDVVDFYDDMTYNHEKGSIRYYSVVIEELKKLNINYYGADFLLKIQKRSEW